MKLPYSDIHFIDPSPSAIQKALDYKKTDDIGFILEVDIEYPLRK